MIRRSFCLAIMAIVLLALPALAATVRTVAQVYTPTRAAVLNLAAFPVTIEEPDQEDYTRIV
ncbi:MAG: hypothetical protein GX444_13340, partial [Myxococcales bacterium]|nr:hypothetical protein [Myxococcales bacterium]